MNTIKDQSIRYLVNPEALDVVDSSKQAERLHGASDGLTSMIKAGEIKHIAPGGYLGMELTNQGCSTLAHSAPKQPSLQQLAGSLT